MTLCEEVYITEKISPPGVFSPTITSLVARAAITLLLLSGLLVEAD